MSDHEAFIAKIVENPADDLPKFVFADWLEERGEDDRAKMIRDPMVIRWRRTQPGRWSWYHAKRDGDPVFCGSPYQGMLAKSFRLGIRYQIDEVWFRHGFAFFIGCSHRNVWGSVGPEIVLQQPIEKVGQTLRGRWPSLKSIRFYRGEIATVRAIAGLPHFKSRPMVPKVEAASP